ncbi:MAG: exopolyphosphatase [Thermoanaerobaculaceae bacterium]|nr:exopolyphosphatase [Thermoanaerobaculaceae bacterium]
MRLITRGDVDGLMCAVLLKAAGIVDTYVQAHPKEMQDGTVEVTADDIVCNLPYAPGCGMWFDHHSSESLPSRQPESFVGRYALAPSAARLVYEYWVDDHPELERFEPLLEVVDRFDSAQLTREDVLRPSPAMLLVYLLDPRTGLGYHHSFRISNKQMTQMMPDLLLTHAPEEILAMPDLQERVVAYRQMQEHALQVLGTHSRIYGNVLVTDLRDVEEIPLANRFLVYTLPGAEGTNVSIRISRVKDADKVSFQVAHNIFRRTSLGDVGALMAQFGGGGHRGAGTCQISAADADRVLARIMTAVRES